MSCHLSIIGEDFDPDAFLSASGLKVDKITYKGTPRFKTRADSELIPYSYVAMNTSLAYFDNFKKQVEETIIYLQDNYEKLKVIAQTPHVQYANLNFGVYYEDKFMQNHLFTPELLKLCGELGLSIELSIYTASDGDEEVGV